jgi:hypothetical protein
MAKDNLDEMKIYEDIKDIVAITVARIKVRVEDDNELAEDDAKTLFILSRIYASLKDDIREDIKAGLLDKPTVT